MVSKNHLSPLNLYAVIFFFAGIVANDRRQRTPDERVGGLQLLPYYYNAPCMDWVPILLEKLCKLGRGTYGDITTVLGLPSMKHLGWVDSSDDGFQQNGLVFCSETDFLVRKCYFQGPHCGFLSV